jgi:hypothetical protein
MKFARVVLFLFCVSLSLLAQSAAQPNLSGTWLLDLAASDLHFKKSPIASTFTIRHNDPNFHLKRTHVYRDGKRDTWSIDLITDGKHEVVRSDGPNRDVTRMYWDNDVLVLDEKSTAPDGSFGTNVVRYSLSKDEKTLTAQEHEEHPGGQLTNRWVLRKQTVQKAKNN